MLESRVDRLEVALARLTEALAHLTIRVDALAERVETLTARVDELARQMTALAAAMTRLATDVGDLKGDVLELRYRQHLNASFQDILRRLRPVSDEELGRLVEDARQRKALTDDEAAELLRSDLVALGRRPSDGAEAYLVVEVSSVVDAGDVHRAARRARIMAQATGTPAVAAVAGKEASPNARETARTSGTWCVLDGAAFAPTPSS